MGDGLISDEEERLLEGSLSTTEETAERLTQGSLESDADPRLGSEPEDTTTEFGEGSLLSGEFFRGLITVTSDPNIDLGAGVEQAEEGDPTTLYEDTSLEPSPLAASFPRQFDNVEGGGFADETIIVIQDTVDGAVDAARNIGPEWLDEATIGVAALVLLVLLAPYAELGSQVGERV